MLRHPLVTLTSILKLKKRLGIENIEPDEEIRSYLIKFRLWQQNFTDLKIQVNDFNDTVDSFYENLERLLKVIREWDSDDTHEGGSSTESNNVLIRFLESMLELGLLLRTTTKSYTSEVDKAVDQVISHMKSIWKIFEIRIKLLDQLSREKILVGQKQKQICNERELEEIYLLIKVEVPLFFEQTEQLQLLLVLAFVNLHILQIGFLKKSEQFSNIQLIEEYRDKIEGATLLIQDLQSVNPQATQPSATAKKCVAIFTFLAQVKGDLSIDRNQIITILERRNQWFYGEVNGKRGIFPCNYVRLI